MTQAEYSQTALAMKRAAEADQASHHAHMLPDRIVRGPECEKLTGLSRVTIWRLEKQGKFPPRKRLSANAVGWSLQAIQSWIATRNEQEA